MACLRSAESVREFVSAVTSTEAAAGIYTLIRNPVQIYVDCYTDQCKSQCACFAFARRACWPCQQDSCNKITKNIETHLRTHFNAILSLFFSIYTLMHVLPYYRQISRGSIRQPQFLRVVLCTLRVVFYVGIYDSSWP